MGALLGAYVSASQCYDLAIVGVTGSLFPAVTVYLLYRFLGHPLRWWQAVGSAGAITGTARMASAESGRSRFGLLGAIHIGGDRVERRRDQ